MSNSFRFALLLGLFMQAMGAAAAGPPNGDVIELRTHGDVQDASTMDHAIALLSAKVSECVQRKTSSSDKCFCLYPRELSNVRKTYEITMRKHPTWTNNVVSYVQEDRTHVISFGGLKIQLQRACP